MGGCCRHSGTIKHQPKRLHCGDREGMGLFYLNAIGLPVASLISVHDFSIADITASGMGT
jgi:hypothetical protein